MLSSLAKRWTTKVLITEASGQLGTELVKSAQARYGISNVLATDIKDPVSQWNKETKYEKLDVTDSQAAEKLISLYKPNIIYHLASTLSATSELNPHLALKININGFNNILDQAKHVGSRIFAASSIATFGLNSPKIPGDLDIQRPCTYYGVTKVYLELMGSYYHQKHGLDFRCLRVPIITSIAQPGGGAGAFTVNIFYDLIKNGTAVVPLSPGTKMPLVYLDDLTSSIIELMEANEINLNFRTYTMGSASCTAQEYVDEVKKYLDGDVRFTPDYRDPIVKSWPDGTDSSHARRDWGHRIIYDVPKMVQTIYENVSGIV